MAYRSHQRSAPKRNRQETIISISAPNRPTNGAASSLTFADLPEGLAVKAQGFVKPGRLLIDGAWVEAVSGKTFETFNPATEESLGQVAHGAAEDIELAVAAARRCLRRRALGLAPDDAVGARQGHPSHRRSDREERGRAGHARDARQRQAAGDRQGRRRRPVRRPVPLHVGLGDEDRGPHDPDLRRHLAGVGVPRLHAQGADRRRRADHPVELPAADGGLEARPGAGGRRDHRAQARRADAALGAATR